LPVGLGDPKSQAIADLDIPFSFLVEFANPRSSRAARRLDIKGRRLGVQFRRQVSIGGRFIVDLLAPEIRLVVEVDGDHHGWRRHADALRDEALRRLGYHVLRVDAAW
jgi:very-short-patch-repair endonuclease